MNKFYKKEILKYIFLSEYSSEPPEYITANMNQIKFPMNLYFQIFPERDVIRKRYSYIDARGDNETYNLRAFFRD